MTPSQTNAIQWKAFKFARHVSLLDPPPQPKKWVQYYNPCMIVYSIQTPETHLDTPNFRN